jgi:Hypoxia induced protein conserved region
MNTILIILLVAAMIATLVALVRGIIAFLKTTEAALRSEEEGQAMMARQNTMMRNRIIFQGIAVLIIAVMLAASR